MGMKEMCDRIRQLRRKKGLSQRQVALLVGVTPSTVKRWEDCETVPSDTNLAALAQIYEVPMDFLRGEPVPAEEEVQILAFGGGCSYIPKEVCRKIQADQEALHRFSNQRKSMVVKSILEADLTLEQIEALGQLVQAYLLDCRK